MLHKRTIVLTLCVAFCFASTLHLNAGDLQWAENVSIILSPVKKTIFSGEAVGLTMEVTNDLQERITLDQQFEKVIAYTVQSKTDKWATQVEKRYNPLGLHSSRSIAPGSTYSKVVFLREYIAFPEPGTYSIEYKGTIGVTKKSSAGAYSSYAYPVSGSVDIEVRQGKKGELEDVLVKELRASRTPDGMRADEVAKYVSSCEPTIAVRAIKKVMEEKLVHPKFEDLEKTYEYHLKVAQRPLFRVHAAKVLASIGTSEAIAALSQIASNPDNNSSIRSAAMSVMAKNNFPGSIDMLEQALNEEDTQIRIFALRILGGIINNSKAQAAIEKRLNDPDPKVAATARKVYDQIQEQERVISEMNNRRKTKGSK